MVDRHGRDDAGEAEKPGPSSAARHFHAGNASWADEMSSMETPYARLERKMNSVLDNHEGMSSTTGGSTINAMEDASVGSISRGREEEDTPRAERAYQRQTYETPEGLDEEPSVLINRSDRPQSDLQPSQSRTRATPEKQKSSMGTPRAKHNPFSPAHPTTSKAWNGIADLRSTPLNPKMRSVESSVGGTARRLDPTSKLPAGDDSFQSDDSLDHQDLPGRGETPPVTMNFSLPTRSIAKTPAKDAARAVIRDLMEMGDSPAMPTPPGHYRPSVGGSPGAFAAGSHFGAGWEEPSPSRSAFKTGSTLFADHPSASHQNNDTQSRHDLSSPSLPGQEAAPEAELSTVGMPMPKHRRSTLGAQLDFLDESFDDSLDEMPPAVASTSMRAADDQDTTVSQDHYRPHGQSEQEIDNEAFTATLQVGRSAMTGATGLPSDGVTDMMTNNSTRSEAGKVFGGGSKGANQFQLFGPDEMQTFHGGVSVFDLACPKSHMTFV